MRKEVCRCEINKSTFFLFCPTPPPVPTPMNLTVEVLTVEFFFC